MPAEGQVLQLHGPHGHPRRPAHERSTAGRARSVRRSRQHHAAHHHAARPAAARRAEERISSTTIRAHQRSAALDAGRVRRREAQRHVLALPVQRRSGARADVRAGRRAGRSSSIRARARITRSGSPTARRARASTSAQFGIPPAMPAGPADAGRRSGRADLRQDVSAAEVQDRHRPAGRQQRRRLRERHRPAGDLRELERRRLQRARRRQLRRHAQREEDVPGRRAADVLHRRRRGSSICASRS